MLVIAAFGIARPDSFLTVNNLTAILQQAAAPAILAIGLTVPLALGEFDLSIGSMVGLAGASAVALITLDGVPWPAAVLIALLIGLAVGLINGTFIAYLGASSFVQTLAMGVILLGVEYLFTNQQTLYSGIPAGYKALGQSTALFGVNIQIWIALVVAVLAWLFLDQTETGRRIYAVGGNPDAARFAGVSVKRLKVLGFVIVALAATVTGILMTAQGGSASPNAGVAVPAARVRGGVPGLGDVPAGHLQRARDRGRASCSSASSRPGCRCCRSRRPGSTSSRASC